MFFMRILFKYAIKYKIQRLKRC